MNAFDIAEYKKLNVNQDFVNTVHSMIVDMGIPDDINTLVDDLELDMSRFRRKLKDYGMKLGEIEPIMYFLDYVATQFMYGIEVEFEHTDDSDAAFQIAADHMHEFPDYYNRLAKMEVQAKREWK